MKKGQSLIIAIFSIVLICSNLVANDLSRSRLEIKGVKVSKESQAKHIAFREYVKKMQLNISATEGIREISIAEMENDIQDFAEKGDIVWETKVLTFEGDLRAIIWVHPQTEEVYFVIAPWMDNTKNK